MKNYSLLLVLLAFMSAVISCGGSSTPADTDEAASDVSNVTVTIAPLTGAADQTTTIAVSGTFSGAITTPSDWSLVFTLKKQGEDTNLCTATAGEDTGYSLNDTTDLSAPVVTCLHDPFDAGGTYAASISGVTDSGGAVIADASSTFSINSSAFTLTSTDLPAGQEIDLTHVEDLNCGGSNQSPALSWSNTPTTDVESLAITVIDLNATDLDDPSVNHVHWIGYNIDPSVTEIARDWEMGGAFTVLGTGQNGMGVIGPTSRYVVGGEISRRYMGPCPDVGDTHTYEFKVWALSVRDLVDDVEGINTASPSSTYSAIEANDVDSASFTRNYTTTP